MARTFQRLSSSSRVGSEKMRPLVIDAEAKATIGRVLAYANLPENIYRPEEAAKAGGGPCPGDNPALVCKLNTYRCVFSITAFHGKRLRHLSISVPGSKYPNPVAVLLIAEAFGFTGWDGKSMTFPKDWGGGLDKAVRAAVLVQELP